MRETYDAVAAGWDRSRSRALFERAWLDRFLALVPRGAPVLDVGCGAGEPIAGYLISRGHPVTGVDVAPGMLARARARFPEAVWVEADMRAMDFAGRFGGIVAWDSFFHLSRADQRATIPVFGRLLAERGALLVTTGPDDGAATGAVEGRPVPHESLSPAEYARLFEESGMIARAFVAEDPDCAGHSVWLVQARG